MDKPEVTLSDIDKAFEEGLKQVKERDEREKRTIDLLLLLSNSYFDLLAQVNRQKRVNSMQKNLINQCMERIMELEKTAHVNMNTIDIMIDRIQQLEGRSILANFNQRLEQIESRIVSTPSTHEIGGLEERIHQLESYLYTHDYTYFQEEENQSGNSSFEEYEMHHPDPSYVEQEDLP